MPRGVKREWPDDEDLIALVRREGNVTAAARALGCTDVTLRRHLEREGLVGRADEATDRGPLTIPDEGEGVSEAEILRAENQELRKALQRDRKEDVHAERIVRAVEKTLSEYTPKPVRPAKASPVSGGAHHRQLLLLSDFHGGEVVDPEVVNGLNDYSWQIMLDRVDQLIEAVLSHGKHCPPLTGLDVLFLGDMCSGSNHDELAQTNEFPLAEQAVKMGELQGQIVERLLPHFASVRVGGVEGNHPRLTKKPAAKRPHDNGDWIANVFAKQYLAPHDVDYTIGRGSLIWEIAGRRLFVWHGDGVRSSMPGIPEGGIARRVNTIQAGLRVRVDSFVHAHFHTAYVKQAGRLIGNGSLKGTDEWVQKAFGAGEPPTQLLLTFDEAAERMTDVRYLTPGAGVPS